VCLLLVWYYPLLLCRAPGSSEKRESGIQEPQPSAGGWAKAVGVIGARSTPPIAPSNGGFGLNEGSLTLGAQREESLDSGSSGGSSGMRRTTSDPAGLNPDASAFRGGFLAGGDSSSSSNGDVGLAGALGGGAFSELSNNNNSGSSDSGIDSMFGSSLLDGAGSSLSDGVGGGGSKKSSSFMMGLFASESSSGGNGNGDGGLASSRLGTKGSSNASARGGGNGGGDGGFFNLAGGGEGSDGGLDDDDDDDDAARDAEAFGDDAPLSSHNQRDLEARLRVSEEAELEASRKCRQAERDRDEALVSLSRATAQLATGSSSSNSGGGAAAAAAVAGGGVNAAEADAKWGPKCEKLEVQVAALQRENDALRQELALLKKKASPSSLSSPIASLSAKEGLDPTSVIGGRAPGLDNNTSGDLGGGNSGFDAGFNLGHLGGGLGGLRGFGNGGFENGSAGNVSDVDSMFGPSGSLGLDFGASSSSSTGSDSLLGSGGLNGSLLGNTTSNSSSRSFGSGLGGFSFGASSSSSSSNSGGLASESAPSSGGAAPRPLVASQPGIWTCEHCTFQNSGQADRGGSKICELCNMPSA